MANPKNDPKTESSLDIATLQENLKGLEMEKSMLKEQKERAEAEKKLLEEAREEDSKKHAQEIKSLEEKIEKLTSEELQLQEDRKNLEEQLRQASSNMPETDELKQKLTELTGKLEEAQQKAQAAEQKHQEQVNVLHEEIEALKTQKSGIMLNPFTTAFLNALAAKLSKHYKKDVTPASILEDYVIRYNLTEKYSLWFHDWVISEKDAVEIAQTFNPAIKNFRDLQKALNIH